SVQISGHKPRHAGSGSLILTAQFLKEKLKFLIADIDLLDEGGQTDEGQLGCPCATNELSICVTLIYRRQLPCRLHHESCWFSIARGRLDSDSGGYRPAS